MIVNAHCHRNLREESCIQVSLFDDRLEVSSPGGLYGGITYEDIMNGHSKLRNRALANIFNQMGLIEAWGTGIGRIRELAKSYGLPEPEFTEMPSFFRVNLYRKPLPMQSIGKTSVEHRQNIGENDNHQFKTDAKLNTTQQKIINLLSEQPEMTGAQLAEQIGISKRNIENNIKTLRELGMLIRHGSARNGYWEVVSGEGTESGNGQR